VSQGIGVDLDGEGWIGWGGLAPLFWRSEKNKKKLKNIVNIMAEIRQTLWMDISFWCNSFQLHVGFNRQFA